MAVKGVEIENWLSHWLPEKKGIMKSRKIPVLEPEENNCQMKLLIPSFWGFESLPGVSLPVKFAAPFGSLLSALEEPLQEYIGSEIVETSGNNWIFQYCTVILCD